MILHFMHGKPLKIEKSNLFIYFSLFFLNAQIFFLLFLKLFSQVHSVEKRLWNSFGISRGITAIEITKLGSLANFFYLENLKNNFLTATKILIAKREK